jgi:sugar/nucleoside kinase (ribokinase family)
LIVSIDIDNIFEGITDLLPLIDIFTTSSSFPARFTGSANEKIAMRDIAARFGCGVVGTTRGQSGSIFLCEDIFVETPAFGVPDGCKDTTGAGDAFRAGLLYGLLAGESLETSARAANAVAALKCRQFGARSGLPNKEELNMLLKNS